MHHDRHTFGHLVSICARKLALPPVGLAAAILSFGLSPLMAQVHPDHHGVPRASAASESSQATPPAAPPKAQSLLEQPPTNASISATKDSLSIQADNASLTQTLQRIAEKTGMHLEGLNNDQRIFGTFGPGAPRDVLNSLLDGTGYNVIMVGSLDNGAPRQLILSLAKSGGGSQAQTPPPPSQPASSDDDSNPDASPDDQLPTPPQTFTPPPGSDQAPPPNGRTPQQMLQQLQELRQQQQAPPQ